MCLEEFQMQGGAKSLRGFNVDSAPLLLIMIYIYIYSPCDCFILDLKKRDYQRLSSCKIEQKKLKLIFCQFTGGRISHHPLI